MPIARMLNRMCRGDTFHDITLVPMGLAPPARGRTIIVDLLLQKRRRGAARDVTRVTVLLASPAGGTSIIGMRSLIPGRGVAPDHVTHVPVLHASPACFPKMVVRPHVNESCRGTALDITLPTMFHAP